MTALFHLFYVSEATTSDAQVVESIADQSQANNRRDRITGLLLFDGKCWCQYIEGPEVAIDHLHERLRRDTRHRDMQVIRHGAMDGGRKFPSWRMGFSYVADEAAIQRVLHAERTQALQALDDIDYSVDEKKYGGA